LMGVALIDYLCSALPSLSNTRGECLPSSRSARPEWHFGPVAAAVTPKCGSSAPLSSWARGPASRAPGDGSAAHPSQAASPSEKKWRKRCSRGPPLALPAHGLRPRYPWVAIASFRRSFSRSFGSPFGAMWFLRTGHAARGRSPPTKCFGLQAWVHQPTSGRCILARFRRGGSWDPSP